MSLERADQLRDFGRWAEAERVYADLLEQDPGNADALFGHALTLRASGDPAGAVAEFSEVLRHVPERADARYLRAVTYAEMGRDEEAAADLNHLLAAGFTEWYVWSDRGALLFRADRLDEAIADLREAVRLNPGEPVARHNLGCALANSGALDEAFENLTLAVRGEVPNAAGVREQVRRQLALRVKEADLDAAIDALRATRTPGDTALLADARPYLLDPGVLARLEAAAEARPDTGANGDWRWIEDLRRLSAPVRDVKRRPRRQGETAEAPADLAAATRYARLAERLSLLRERGHLQEATAIVPELVELAAQAYGEGSAEYGVQVMNLALAEAGRGSWESADHLLSVAAAVLVDTDPPSLVSGFASYAASLSNAGNKDGAHAAYAAAVSIAQRLAGEVDPAAAARAYKGYADGLVRRGEAARAEEVLRRAVSDSEFTPEGAGDSLSVVLTSLGEAVFAQGRAAEAIELCERALELTRELHGELHPRVASAMRNLGRVYLQAGRAGEAHRWLTRSAEVWRQLGGKAANLAEQALTEADLSVLYAGAGAREEARTVAATTLATVGRLAGTLDPQVPYVLAQVGAAFRRLGDLEAELGVQQQLIAEVRRRSPGKPTAEQLNTLADIYYRLGRNDEARQYYTEALDIVAVTEPDNHEVAAILRHNLANILDREGHTEASLKLHEEALAGLRKAWPAGNPRLLGALLEVAELYADAGQDSAARKLLAEAQPCLADHAELEARAAELASQLGVDPAAGSGLIPGAVRYGLLAQEAKKLTDAGSDKDAERLLEQALPMALAAVGPRHLDIAWLKFNLALVRSKQGSLMGVPELVREALQLREELLGPAHELTATARVELAGILLKSGEDTAAAEQVLQFMEHEPADSGRLLLGPALSILGLAEQHRGNLGQAETHLRTALQLADREDDPVNRVTARWNLAELLTDSGQAQSAEDLADEALDLATRHFGPEDPTTMRAMVLQAKVLRAQGRYPDSEALLRRALGRIEQAESAGSPDFADLYNELGLALAGQGQPQRAEPWFRRASTAARSGLPGRDSTLMLNQAAVYADMGNAQQAVSLAKHAVERLEERTGREDPRYARALGKLGSYQLQAGQHLAGVQNLIQACRILETALGPESPSRLEPLSELAQAYLTIGARETARSFAETALKIARTIYSPAHPALALHLIRLARCQAVMGDITEAMNLSQTATELTPTATGNLRWLAWLQAATGARTDAIATMERVIELENAQLQGVLDLASEEHRTAYLATLWESVHQYLTLLCPDSPDADVEPDPAAVRRAWELVISRRGLNGEYLRFERQIIIRTDSQELSGLLRELTEVRGDIGRAVIRSDISDTTRLRQRRNELEHLLASRIPVGDRSERLGPLDSGQLIAMLPPGTTLIEYIRNDITDFANLTLGTPIALDENDPLKPRRQQRYLAFVVSPGHSPEVHLVRLGESGPIDQHVTTLRSLLVPPAGAGALIRQATERDMNCAALSQALFEPLRKLVRPDRGRLLVVADGPVSHIPLQILLLSTGRRVIDEHSITYLSSTREMTRWNAGTSPRPATEALIIADPEFNLGETSTTESASLLHSLPGTRAEAREIGALLDVEPLTGAAAVKIALEEARSPAIVHLATHGLFLPASEPRTSGNHYETVGILEVPGEGSYLVEGDHGETAGDRNLARLPGPGADPLLRSAIALAGFNTWVRGTTASPDAGNGLLTADEVCTLDLRNTRIVVLSACETGLGDRKPAEGVIGLRWAFGVAGAAAIVTSLWQIADKPTQELMIDFYRRLMEGTPVPDALRAAQLYLRERYSDPYWWGAFACHGDPKVTLR